MLSEAKLPLSALKLDPKGPTYAPWVIITDVGAGWEPLRGLQIWNELITPETLEKHVGYAILLSEFINDCLFSAFNINTKDFERIERCTRSVKSLEAFDLQWLDATCLNRLIPASIASASSLKVKVLPNTLVLEKDGQLLPETQILPPKFEERLLIDQLGGEGSVKQRLQTFYSASAQLSSIRSAGFQSWSNLVSMESECLQFQKKIAEDKAILDAHWYQDHMKWNFEEIKKFLVKWSSTANEAMQHGINRIIMFSYWTKVPQQLKQYFEEAASCVKLASILLRAKDVTPTFNDVCQTASTAIAHTWQFYARNRAFLPNNMAATLVNSMTGLTDVYSDVLFNLVREHKEEVFDYQSRLVAEMARSAALKETIKNMKIQLEQKDKALDEARRQQGLSMDKLGDKKSKDGDSNGKEASQISTACSDLPSYAVPAKRLYTAPKSPYHSNHVDTGDEVTVEDALYSSIRDYNVQSQVTDSKPDMKASEVHEPSTSEGEKEEESDSKSGAPLAVDDAFFGSNEEENSVAYPSNPFLPNQAPVDDHMEAGQQEFLSVAFASSTSSATAPPVAPHGVYFREGRTRDLRRFSVQKGLLENAAAYFEGLARLSADPSFLDSAVSSIMSSTYGSNVEDSAIASVPNDSRRFHESLDAERAKLEREVEELKRNNENLEASKQKLQEELQNERERRAALPKSDDVGTHIERAVKEKDEEIQKLKSDYSAAMSMAKGAKELQTKFNEAEAAKTKAEAAKIDAERALEEAKKQFASDNESRAANAQKRIEEHLKKLESESQRKSAANKDEYDKQLQKRISEEEQKRDALNAEISGLRSTIQHVQNSARIEQAELARKAKEAIEEERNHRFRISQEATDTINLWVEEHKKLTALYENAQTQLHEALKGTGSAQEIDRLQREVERLSHALKSVILAIENQHEECIKLSRPRYS